MKQGLYDTEQFQDSCGFGLLANHQGIASHTLLQKAIAALTKMTHRGGIAADGKTGDGCGLLLQLPDAFMRIKAAELGYKLNKSYAVGFFMLSQDKDICAQQVAFIENFINKQLKVIGWRDVPINTECLGEVALQQLPTLKQLFIDSDNSEQLLKAKLMVLRKQISYSIPKAINDNFYIVSMDANTIVYKGLMMPANLSDFYLDLKDPALKTTICVFHQRFSTNTLPKWQLAQPFRMLAHNGEINTIVGNRNWAMARVELLTSPIILEAIGGKDLVEYCPYCQPNRL